MTGPHQPEASAPHRRGRNLVRTLAYLALAVTVALVAAAAAAGFYIGARSIGLL